MQLNKLPQAPTSTSASATGFALSPGNYSFLQEYIYKESGIVIDASKQYLLESRLLPLVRSNGIGSLNALSELLAKRKAHPVAQLVIEAMTTNETLFFRDPAMYESLRTEILPPMLKRLAGKRKLRIWSAAASSGQEAYSIAMMLLELGATKREVEIVGTDLSTHVLDRAKQGKYVQFEVNRGLPANMLMKYFTPSGLEWQVKDQVKDMVRFEQMDLRRDFRFLGMFDLVLCRNVLIYFDTETKKKIVEMLHSVLSPEALLVLGCAETIINIHTGYQRKTIGQANFYSL